MTDNSQINQMLNTSDDYYAILEIDKTSDESTIKKAYRKLALKYHPDRNINNKEESEVEFKKISEAYCILSDSKRKRLYDQFGSNGLKGEGIHVNISPMEIFNSFFGNDSMFSQGMPNVMFMSSTVSMNGHPNFIKRQACKAEPITKEVDCTLQDVYNGSNTTIKITKLVNIEGKLTKCSENMEISVPKGILDKDEIIYRNSGNESLEGDKGDIIIKFNVIEDTVFKRDGNDLYLEKNILLSEALTGYQFILKSVSGEKIVIESNDQHTIDSDTLHVIKKLGVPDKNDPDKIGDLYITYKIIFPTDLLDDRKELLKKILPVRDPLPDRSKTLKREILEDVVVSQDELDEMDDSLVEDKIHDTDDNLPGSNMGLPNLQFPLPGLDMGMNLMKDLPIKEISQQCMQQ